MKSLEPALTQDTSSDLGTASLYCNLESSPSHGTQKTLEHVQKIETLYIWCRMQAPLWCSLEGWFLTLLRNLFILTSRSGNCGLVRGHPSMKRDHCEVLGWLASHWSPCSGVHTADRARGQGHCLHTRQRRWMDNEQNPDLFLCLCKKTDICFDSKQTLASGTCSDPWRYK